MSQKRNNLGRGLGDLFARTEPDESAEGDEIELVDGSRFAEIPLAQISPNPRQPRTVFDEDDLEELRGSIAEFGVLQPVVVREVSRENYELVMGERRWRASKLAGRETIPAIVRATDDNDLLRDALLENLHRANLNPLEEAAAYRQMLDDFACTQEELSQRVQRSRPQISNTLRLLQLPTRVQSKVAAGVLSAGHARALLRLEDEDAMERLADRVVAEGLSVRSTEELVALGETGAPTRSQRVPRLPTPDERELGQTLSDRFDTRVKVQIGRNKGRITIEFGDQTDLDRIVALLDGKTI